MKIFFLALFFFSFWLMFHTFSYGSKDTLYIADKAIDFGLNIPLVRSFSLGNNWPPQYPLFPGPPIRYHFLFYLLVAQLEKAGMPLDWALNIPSALGFFFLLVMAYLLTKKMFKSTLAAVLSVVFLLFNGSLSFIPFFAAHPLSWQTPKDIMTNATYPAFGPWDGGDIAIFWNLLVYINQRHLALAYGIVLLFVYTCLSLEHLSIKKDIKWSIFWGIIIGGLFPYFNQPMLLVFAIIITTYLLVFPKIRRFLLVAGGIATILVLLQFEPFTKGASSFAWYPGYLIHDSLSITHFISYWWQNLGLYVLLIPIGLFLAPSLAKKALLPLFAIFIIFNLFQFSPDIANSHKFFKFFLILGSMAASYAIVHSFERMKKKRSLFLRLASYPLAVIIIFFLTFSGIIDFFVVKNEYVTRVDDIPKNKIATWFLKNTPPDVVVLSSNTNFYHPASLAGRKIFIGWPNLVSSIGYDTTGRLKEAQGMFTTEDLHLLCRKLTEEKIDYVTYQPFQPSNITGSVFMNAGLFDKHFSVVYYDEYSKMKIYSVEKTCK